MLNYFLYYTAGGLDFDLTYDNSGNVLSEIDSSAGVSVYYEWEGRNLTAYEYIDGNGDLDISYEYNQNGIRTSKTIDRLKPLII